MREVVQVFVVLVEEVGEGLEFHMVVDLDSSQEMQTVGFCPALHGGDFLGLDGQLLYDYYYKASTAKDVDC